LEMGAEDVRRRAVHRHLRERTHELVLGRGDEGRLVRRHTALQQGGAGAAIALGVRGEEVDAGEAVHLKIDEPGRSDARSVRRAQPDGSDMAVRELDVAGNETPVDQRCPDAEPHAYPATPATA